MFDVWIWIGVWSVILIMLIISLMKIDSRIAEDIMNKIFEDLKKRKGEKMTMPRYIDANEFKMEMEKYLPEDRELALKVLKSIKTADVMERKHGKWIIDEDGNIECSVCGNNGVGDLYCERCGAQMNEIDITKMRVKIENLE